MAVLDHPMMPITVRSKTPSTKSTVAAVCRASCSRASQTPAARSRALHTATLYASHFRYDDTMLANPHMWGAPASANPVLQLRRIEGSTWFDGYRRSFDAVWDTALPWTP